MRNISRRYGIFRAALCVFLALAMLLPAANVRAEGASVTWSADILPEGPLEVSISGAEDGCTAFLAVYDGDSVESIESAAVSGGAASLSADVSSFADRAKVYISEQSELPLENEAIAELTAGAVYRGFGGRYQHIFVGGHKIREEKLGDDEGLIVVDDSERDDMSDMFLPRDMGDGSYAFEPRSSNQSYMKEEMVEVYDPDYDTWEWEKKTVEAWRGFTRRIAAAEEGVELPSTLYKFDNIDMSADKTFDGMNDDTQHWFREKSENYTPQKPSYYLRSYLNGLYMGLSEDGRVIAVDEADRAEVTFEALNDESPLYKLSKTEAYALLTDAQRERIEKVYESVAGDAFERNGTAVAENTSPRGRLDNIYKNNKNPTEEQVRQALANYTSMSQGYVVDHPTSNYEVSWDLPGTQGVTVQRSERSGTYGYPNWYNFTRTSKTFKIYDLNIYGADGGFQQNIEMWVQQGGSGKTCGANADAFEQIVTKIPLVYRKDITTIMIEEESDNSYYSAGPHLYIRLSHPNGAGSILNYMIHEMGHSLDARRGGGSRNWSATAGYWDAARHADMFAISKYGASESVVYNSEDFAEFCRYYFTCCGNADRQRALQILCPNRYELFSQVRKENLDGFSLWEDGIVPPDSTPKPKYFIPEKLDFEGGSVTFDKTEAEEGEDVTLTVTPPEGYELGTLDVGGETVLGGGSENTYTFKMPDNDIDEKYITACFDEIEGKLDVDPVCDFAGASELKTLFDGIINTRAIENGADISAGVTLDAGENDEFYPSKIILYSKYMQNDKAAFEICASNSLEELDNSVVYTSEKGVSEDAAVKRFVYTADDTVKNIGRRYIKIKGGENAALSEIKIYAEKRRLPAVLSFDEKYQNGTKLFSGRPNTIEGACLRAGIVKFALADAQGTVVQEKTVDLSGKNEWSVTFDPIEDEGEYIITVSENETEYAEITVIFADMPIMEIGDAAYSDGVITLPVAVFAEGVSEDINIFAAEYVDDALINLAHTRETVTESRDITLDYIRSDGNSELKLFVWSDEQAPYRGAQTLY